MATLSRRNHPYGIVIYGISYRELEEMMLERVLFIVGCSGMRQRWRRD